MLHCEKDKKTFLLYLNLFRTKLTHTVNALENSVSNFATVMNLKRNSSKQNERWTCPELSNSIQLLVIKVVIIEFVHLKNFHSNTHLTHLESQKAIKKHDTNVMQLF